MFGEPEVPHRACRDLADAIGPRVGSIGQLAVLDQLPATEKGPLRMRQRSFGGPAVVIVALRRLPAPSERPRRSPAGRDVVSPQRTRRPAGLVDTWLKLLGIDKSPPASLQRQSPRWIP